MVPSPVTDSSVCQTGSLKLSTYCTRYVNPVIVKNENVKSAPLIADARIEGGSIARPVNSFVESPPLLVNVMTFVKIPGTADPKLMTRFVHSNVHKLKDAPETMVKGLGEMAAEPLSVAVPALLITRVACLVSRVVIRPKSTRVGVATNWAGVITTIKLVRAIVFVPPGPVATRLTL